MTKQAYALSSLLVNISLEILEKAKQQGHRTWKNFWKKDESSYLLLLSWYDWKSVKPTNLITTTKSSNSKIVRYK